MNDSHECSWTLFQVRRRLAFRVKLCVFVSVCVCVCVCVCVQTCLFGLRGNKTGEKFLGVSSLAS